MAIRSIPIRRQAAVGVVFAAICALAFWKEPAQAGSAEVGRWFSIVPPLLAVSMALLTGRILLSLASAILVGGLLSTAGADPLSPLAWLKGVGAGVGFIWSSVSDFTNLQILVFVVLVMAMIGVMIVAGGLHGVVLWLSRFARGPRSTQLVTALMGFAVFIDDYANTMIVGSAMRPMTDAMRVSREKLAFLVDSTSAPVAGLAVISTWVGYEVGLFEDSSATLGLGVGGYSMLFDALPSRFYCILMLGFVLINAVSGRDFGPMARAERRARETGALAEQDAVPMTSKAFTTSTPDAGIRVRATSAVIPIAALFAFLLGGMWIDGGGGAAMGENPLGFLNPRLWRDVIGASQNSIALLAVAAAVGLVIAIVLAALSARLAMPKIGRATAGGLNSSVLPVTILVMAWSLKASCDALGTGPFLVETIGRSLSPVWFPALVFVIASLTSFATGTSYGTMAILIPTAVPIAFELEGQVYGPTTILCLAAILDGSIFGDHCSPISDTTIMSSISSSCDHLHHVRTQLPYSITVAVLALALGYVPAALGMPSWIGITAALALIAVFFYALRRWGRPIASGAEGAQASAR